MNFLLSDKKSMLILFIIYLVTNSFFLLNYNGIYWDDWGLHNQEYSTIENMYVSVSGYLGYLNIFIQDLFFNINGGIFLSRLLTFVLFFLNAVMFIEILKKFQIISEIERFFIVIFFLIAPLNSAKIAVINFPAELRVFIFFFSFYLLSKYLFIDSRKLYLRIVILFLFIISFTLPSLLVFYALVLIYIFYNLYDIKLTVLKNFILFIKTNIDFIFLPIIFYVVKLIYCMPTGIYQGYNKINIENILNLDNYYHTFLWSFIEPINLSMQNISSLIIVAFVVLLLLSNAFSRQNNDMNKKDIYLLTFGFIVFFLGAFAYLAVGKIPTLNDWESRFQVLLPIGFSFILYYGIQIISNLLNFKVVIKYFLYLILIISFVSFHLKEQLKYNIDWFYQQSIIENFKISGQIVQNSTFIVENELYFKLAKSRALRYYELNGMSKDAFSKDDKLFVSNENQITLLEDLKIQKEMNYSLWVKEPPIYFKMKVNPNVPFNKGQVQTLKYFFMLKYLEIFNQTQFKKEIKNLVFFEFK
ncbi:hypothetical protein [Arcobacter sp.]|uniref:hypothetical protein n=1 Tax=unclassified Arcobacter TaxID=2593671 RepID=UPI003B00DA34